MVPCRQPGSRRCSWFIQRHKIKTCQIRQTCKKVAKSSSKKSLQGACHCWRNAIHTMSPYGRARQVALSSLCWVSYSSQMLSRIPFLLYLQMYRQLQSESGMPEWNRICSRVTLSSTIIRPLYWFIRARRYEVVEGKFVRQERDHDWIFECDDVNQLFWYPEGNARIVTVDKVSNTSSKVDSCLMFLQNVSVSRTSHQPNVNVLCSLTIATWTVFFKTFYKNARSFTSKSTPVISGSFTSRSTGSALPKFTQLKSASPHSSYEVEHDSSRRCSRDDHSACGDDCRADNWTDVLHRYSG
jgi:hypothetical protein